ncbi:MAG TPA: phosphatase [Ruminococcaceae bacterium]|nr:phosphatase [Oscillospiraceae bacterium]
MHLIADTHMHTVASTHAYSTLQEDVHAAAQQGLYAVAITDHGALMPGAPGKWYFENLCVVPRQLEGVLVLRGEETDVMDCDGNTDLDPNDLKTLDWVVASIHRPVFSVKLPSVEQVTSAWLGVAKNPHVNVIGHSGTADYVYDYEKVLPEFARSGKLVELNESTFRNRKTSVPNCTKIMKLCKKLSVPIIVNTDSHFSSQIGHFEHSLKLLDELNFPEELVVNSSIERFKAYLRQYTGVFSKK